MAAIAAARAEAAPPVVAAWVAAEQEQVPVLEPVQAVAAGLAEAVLVAGQAVNIGRFDHQDTTGEPSRSPVVFL
ncbi:MAG TPA: hypothetical protein VFL51_07870 [Pseudolabrys sp.]|nr:hypothetical protein [Pseudolabrys sp.]